MRRPRHLSNEERALWDRVAGTAMPLDPARPVEPPVPAAKPRLPTQPCSQGVVSCEFGPKLVYPPIPE